MTNDDKENLHKIKITPAQYMISSCIGGLITSAIVTPMDVVKIRLQSQQKALLSDKCFLYNNGLMDHVCRCVNGKMNEWVKRPSHFTSTFDAFQKIIKHEGIASLWSGLPPTLVMAVPSTIIYFVSYEQLRLFMIDKYTEKTGNKEYPVSIPLMAGAIARTWSVTVISPLELIRTKMQSKKISYQELKMACWDLYEAKGIRGFWLGYIPTLFRDVPFSAIYWGCYEAQKKMFGYQQKQIPTWFSFVGGAVAGSIAGTVTLPFDVIKTHKQMEMGEVDFKVKGKRLETSGEIAARIIKRTGYRGLFAGLTPRILRIAPSCALMLSSFEFGKNFFMNYNRRKYEIAINAELVD